MTATAVVYRAYDGADQLLYVGCSTMPGYRMEQHARRSAWWPEMVRVEYSERLDRRAALALERDLIWSLGPIYNQPPSNMRGLRFRPEDIAALLDPAKAAS